MANKILEGKILHVVKTTSQWASESTVVTKGLLCVEFTDDGKTRLKIGDGINSFSKLVYCDGNVDLSDYYTKSETSDAISEAITAIGTVMTIKGTVNSFSDLPTTGNTAGDVYFVANTNSTANDGYAEYVWVVPSSGSARWEYIGTVAQDVDLSGYATITYVDSEIAKLTALAHSHSNKTILDNTTASFTTALNTKLSGIETGANKTVVDSALSSTSTNPVQNKVVNTAMLTHTHTVVNGHTVESDVPANAKFTDTTYSVATTSANGLMSSTDKTKLDGIETGATKTVIDSALSSTSTNPVQNKIINTALAGKSATSHTHTVVNGHTVESDVPANAVFTDTTYSVATTSTNGLMSASDKTKLNGVATGAEVNQNAFSNVVVGTTTITADNKTDSLTFVAGANVTITPDATNDKVTFSATDTVYDDTALTAKVQAIEDDYIKSTDTIIINCIL